MNTAEKWHGTTIVLLRKNGETVVAGDGQVSLGNTVLKSKAKKVCMEAIRTSQQALVGDTLSVNKSRDIHDREAIGPWSLVWRIRTQQYK